MVFSKTRAWSYQKKFSDLRNFQKKSQKILSLQFLSEGLEKLFSLYFGLTSLLEI
jgi:hypothetical protein